MKITLVNGLIADIGSYYYNNINVWISKPEKNSKALIIRKNNDTPITFNVTDAIVEKIISYNDLNDENEYNFICSQMQSEYDLCCEFVTESNAYYVGIHEAGIRLNDITEITYDHCSYY